VEEKRDGAGDGGEEVTGPHDTVMVESETEKLRGDRVSLYLVQGRQGRDKEIEVDFGVILHSKVVDDENKTDKTSYVTKQTGSGSFKKTKEDKRETGRWLLS
jgi:hypothetical protein